ncbi:hypothetical protein M9H77_05790 [Catharanthus roseus]|uniref:Uncharacterized protein n=1 Tax=Catharanthus roseus TaxID=4058 RepID=A0ACC0CHU9_CATRO|nr:hypothetical protein M9H77_05790 [Catharanthus roseus]
MKVVVVTLVTAVIIAGQLPLGLTIPSTAPAFLWSPYQDGLSNRMAEPIKYRTLFPRDLAKSVMFEGGWSSLLCSGNEAPESPDFAFLFVGKELQSRDISRPIKADRRLVDSLGGSFRNSSFSIAFPYVASPEENEAMESSLISQFVEACGNGLEMENIAVLDSCSVDGEAFKRLRDISAVQEYMVSNIRKKSGGQANLIVICHGVSAPKSVPEEPLQEGEIFSRVMGSIEQLNAKYTVLYVSDPFGPIEYRSYRGLERFLAEGTFGNGSANSSTCDGVCQIKSSLLEGILVGFVLLIILISGLCCMAGIDTPTRFETPQDS